MTRSVDHELKGHFAGAVQTVLRMVAHVPDPEARRIVDLRREKDRETFELHLERDAGAVSVRLGPLPAGKEVASAKLNGAAITFRNEPSGDSRWVWVEVPGGKDASIVLAYGKP